MQISFHFPLIVKYFGLHIVFIKVQGLGLHLTLRSNLANVYV